MIIERHRRPANRLGFAVHLAWATDRHLREDTIRAALMGLDQFVLHHPLAHNWGDGTRSSSDGMRVRVAVNDGEAINSASRAIFVGQRGEFRDRHV